MDRLTTNYMLCNQIIDCGNEMCSETCDKQHDCKECPINKAINKLADYEDQEEQGLLLKLPCKIGTPVWTIMCGMTGKNPSLFKQDFELSMLDHFGKAVFLTKEEAEQALAEMKGGQDEK